MARPCTCHNLLSTSKDGLAKDILRAFTKGSSTSIPIFVTFYTPTPIFALTAALSPPNIYTDVNL